MKQKNYTIGVLGSHSALDVCRGAKDEGFTTLVVAEKGREKTYSEYYKTNGDVGCVDECLVLEKFSDILKPEIQDELTEKKVIFVPNRSFEAYLKFDYQAIENKWKIPTYGNKFLLKIEERGVRPNQYDLLDAADIRYPKHYKDPKKIDRLCLVKASEKERIFERASFLVSSYKDYQQKVKELLRSKKITEEAVEKAVIEEFVTGAQVNFNFFYSPITKKVELLGTDMRRQTNLDGLLRIPGLYQEEILTSVPLSYEEAGHIAVTVLESLLEPAFMLAERFVRASQALSKPGIVGPFALQSIVTPGPPKKEIIVIDVSPRMPGSPGINATPYSQYLYGSSISVGRRVAKDIRESITTNRLSLLLS